MKFKLSPKAGRPKPFKLGVDCSPEMYEEVSRLAAKANISRGEFTRQALKYALENYEKDT